MLTEWLINTEKHYSETTRECERRVLSELDPRVGVAAEEAKMAKSGMIGGDRFTKHGYAPWYAKEFKRFLGKKITIVELGILQGVGLAVLCDLFPEARIIGLDVDLSHFYDNEKSLRDLGAFKCNQPEIYYYDEMAASNYDFIKAMLGSNKITIFIDDALHIPGPILKTETEFRPFMTKKSAYFVEDCNKSGDLLRRKYPDDDIRGEGKITVISK